MKPRNFQWRKLRRQAEAKARRGEQLTEDERLARQASKDIRQRIGRRDRSL